VIYWERVNPRFVLALPVEMTMDVWDWRDRRWADIDEYEELPWSPIVSEIGAADEVRVRIPTEGNEDALYHDYLVIYGLEGEWRLILLGFREPGQLDGFSQDPPFWWFAGEPTPLHQLLARARSRREIIRSYAEKRRMMDIPPPEMMPGCCRTCGLPLKKHVDHQPPGVQLPKDGGPLEEWKVYRKAFTEHYLTALRNLTEDELLGMSLPKGAHHLRVLEVEVKHRIDHPPEVKNRIDLLLADDDGLGD